MELEYKEAENNLIKVVTAVIIDKKGERVLVAQRAATASHPGKWTFIGGKVEPGESPEEALKREVAEETSLQIRVGRLLGFAEVDYRNLGRPSHHISYYSCEIITGVARLYPDIHADVRWIQISNLSQLDWIEGDIEFANKLAVSLTAPAPSLN